MTEPSPETITPPAERREDVIEAVERALRVLQVFSAEYPSLTLSDAAKLTNLSRGTARRILLTFEALGFVKRDGNQFSLTPRVLRLGYGYLSSLPIWDRAQPHMRELADAVMESCSVATLDGEDIVYVARVPSRRNLSITLTVGSRLPAYATSMGHVLLAWLDDEKLADYLAHVSLKPLTAMTITEPAILMAELTKVRQKGYSIVDSEREEGVRSVSAPIRDRSGVVIAALNISTSAGRVSLKDLRERFAPQVIETARRISADLATV